MSTCRKLDCDQPVHLDGYGPYSGQPRLAPTDFARAILRQQGLDHSVITAEGWDEWLGKILVKAARLKDAWMRNLLVCEVADAMERRAAVLARRRKEARRDQ